MWVYSESSAHKFLLPEPGAQSIGKADRCHFLNTNPKIFYLPECCPYCGAHCKKLGDKDQWSRSQSDLDVVNDVGQLLVCQKCGWWTVAVVSFREEIDSEFMRIVVGQKRGELKQFNTKAEGVPLDELHRYLLVHYDKRGSIDAYKIEDAVAAIYRDGGYKVVTTQKSRDGGIDLYIAQKNDADTMAVQVKRTRNKISVDLIRAFVGALVREGLSRGVFVTTNEFTVDTRSEARQFSERGYEIELLNCEDLYRMLSINTRSRYLGEDDQTAPFFQTWHCITESATTEFVAMHRVEI